MPDYGHDLLFGCFLTPSAEQAEDDAAGQCASVKLGLDLVSAQDHPYQPAFLDTWTLLSVIVSRTSRIRVFPNVANLPLRPPAMLARAVASLDILSGGRAALGLGAGGFWDAIATMDGPRRSPADAVAALREAIAVIRALWTPGRGDRHPGDYYRLAGARPVRFHADGHLARLPAAAHASANRRGSRRLAAQLAVRAAGAAHQDERDHRRGRGRRRPLPSKRRLYNVAGSLRYPGRRLPARSRQRLERSNSPSSRSLRASAFV